MSIAPLSNLSETRPTVTDALAQAARATGADFSYLLATAKRESGLNSAAKSNSSSATGLFQFIDQTWLATVKKHGGKHGLGAYAEAIEQTASGQYKVADPARREEILALRKDPSTAALMAGELTNDSKAYLEDQLGRPAGGTDLYMAHFLGASGAARFLAAADADDSASAAKLFPAAARANRSVFYNGKGQERSLADVKAHLTALHNGTAPVGEAGAAPQRTAQADTVTGGGFGQIGLSVKAGFGGATPALRLTPEVIQILSTLDPLSGAKSNKESDTSRLLGAEHGLFKA